MRELLEAFPAQFAAASERALRLELPTPTEIRNVVLTGLGGSAIGGDVIRTAMDEHLRVPFAVNRDYRLPRFVSGSTLVFACSYSGNTEETLHAYGEARKLGAPIICIASGGRLAAVARADGCPLIELPAGMQPRAALGYSSILLLGALRAVGLVPDPSEALAETASLLSNLAGRYGLEIPESRNKAKSIARTLAGRIVAVYGSSGLLEAAATRWRSQLEENAKNLAFHHVLPEMNHNELVGWKFPEEALSRIAVVFLRDAGEHSQVRKRFEETIETIRQNAAVVHEVWSEGRSLLARLFSVIYLGDYVSLYAAWLNRVDPTPVEAIESLKRKLGKN
jgi:glucose/mannose-6-phosphate isomerase